VAVLRELDIHGCDFFADVHGDEELPYGFISGTQGIPGWTPRLATLLKCFGDSLRKNCPDFMDWRGDPFGYEVDPPGGANLAICADQVAQRFDCLSVTIEQPFKDCANNPSPECEYSPARATLFGRQVVDSILKVVPLLRLPELPAEVVAAPASDLPADLPVLYGYWRSSSAWRVRIALELKGVRYIQRSVHLAQAAQKKPPYNEHLNTMDQVPTLLLPDGRKLTQSMAIISWLDEVYPDPPLLPSDTFLAAKAMAVAQIPNSFIQPLQNLSTLQAVGALGCERPAWARPQIEKGLAAIECELTKHSGMYCIGDQVTVADICLMPQMYGARRFGADLSQFPLVCAVEANLQKHPAFKKADADAQPDAS